MPLPPRPPSIKQSQEIQTITEAESFDVKDFYQAVIMPVLRLAHEVCAEIGIPHLFTSEVACTIGEGPAAGEFNAFWGNINELRETCLFVAIQAMTAKDEREVGYRLGEVLSNSPAMLEMAILALSKKGLTMNEGLVTAGKPPTTH